MSGDCQKASKAIQSLFVELNNLDLDTILLAQLFQAEVITHRQQTDLPSKGVDEFWMIINDSLRAGYITTFLKLLQVMNASENHTTRDLARQLSEKAGIPIPPPSESKPPEPESGEQQSDHGLELRIDRGKGGGAFDMFQLLECMECVCRIENSHRSEGGTGFVGNIVVDNEEEHFIITCHHVIPNKTAAKDDSLFMFNHIDDQYMANKIKGRDLFDMEGSKWFWTNEKLNYTAIKIDKVKLGEVRYTRKEGDKRRKMEISGIPLHLAKVDMPFDEGHIFTIIQQTPTMKLCEGSCKQRKDEDSAVVKYRLNTALGSGGAPIFKERNGELCLIAMHIGNQNTRKFNFGVRISEVLKDIREEKHASMPADVNGYIAE